MGQLQTREPDYAIREFEDDDAGEFLELHSQIFGPDRSREWFAWKYEENPYVDHVSIFVAERDGDIVGARPFFALDMSVDGERELALQPGDTMVHPDHRRQGLFTRMTEAAIEKYTDGEPSFFFNFPNAKSGPGYLNLGWEKVAEESTYYRIQNTTALGLQGSAAWMSVASAAAKPLLDAYNWLSNFRTNADDGVTVSRYESIPSAMMAAMETDESRDGIHVLRDERFYDWRFDNPSWEYAAYVAEKADEPIAGMVVGTSVESGLLTTKVTDVVPSPPETRIDGLEALLHRLVREYPDADILAAPSILPRATVGSAGFRSDDRPPLSNVANQTTHVVRSLTDDWVHNGVDITNEANWHLTFSERDTS